MNADTLCNLVEANEGGRYNKLIVMQLGAILEAALDQIIYPAQNYNVEGVPNISESERLEIENKKVERFNAVINVLKAHKLPDALGNDIYDEIHKLRRYRNKIHIQDDVEGAARDESSAFSNEICAWASDLTVRVLKYLSENLARPKHLHHYVKPLTIPNPS